MFQGKPLRVRALAGALIVVATLMGRSALADDLGSATLTCTPGAGTGRLIHESASNDDVYVFVDPGNCTVDVALNPPDPSHQFTVGVARTVHIKGKKIQVFAVGNPPDMATVRIVKIGH